MPADCVDQRERFPVRADQDVLTVVERVFVANDPASAAAELARGLVDRHPNAAARECHRSRHAGVTAADDADRSPACGIVHVLTP
jgi:hypothetical protein